MKREDLLRYLCIHGWYLKRVGGSHSLWLNPANGALQAVPRRPEGKDMLAKSIIKLPGLADRNRS